MSKQLSNVKNNDKQIKSMVQIGTLVGWVLTISAFQYEFFKDFVGKIWARIFMNFVSGYGSGDDLIIILSGYAVLFVVIIIGGFIGAFIFAFITIMLTDHK